MFKKLIQSKTLRSRTAWLITAVLVLPFVLFFHFSGGPEGAPGGAAGTLYGRRVPWDEFDAQRRWVRLQWALQFGQIPESLEPMVDGYTWDRLLLIETARREGIRVADRDLAGFIQNSPQFQDQGRFVPERYYEFLAALGTSPAQFERFIKHDLAVERLANRIGDRVQVSDADVEQAYREAEERRGIALLRWSAGTHAPSEATLTDADIEAHYRAREDLVTQPATATFETLGLTREEAAKGVAITDEQVARYYDEHQDEFTADGAVTPLEAVRDQVRQRVTDEAVKRRLTAVAVDLDSARREAQPFEAMAEALGLPVQRHGPHADGNLFVLNAPDPTVMQAAFALRQPGQVSEVVETDRGAHLVRLIARTPERIPPLEEVRAVIVQDLLRSRGRDLAAASAEAARAGLAERLAAGASLEDAAKALKLSLTSLAPVTRTEPVGELGQAPALSAAVFAAPAQQLTPVVETGDGFAVAYVREIVPPDPAGLTETRRTELKTQVTDARRQAELARWMDDVRAKAKPKSFLEGPASGG